MNSEATESEEYDYFGQGLGRDGLAVASLEALSTHTLSTHTTRNNSFNNSHNMSSSSNNNNMNNLNLNNEDDLRAYMGLSGSTTTSSPSQPNLPELT